MSSLATIRDAIKATLSANLSGVYVYDIVPDNPTLPAVVVAPVTAEFDLSYPRGADTWEFDLVVLVARGSDRAGQDKLDALVAGAGSLSVRQVIFQHRTLDLADTDCRVTGMSGYGALDVIGVDTYSARLRLVAQTRTT